MRLSLLARLVCPACLGPLFCFASEILGVHTGAARIFCSPVALQSAEEGEVRSCLQRLGVESIERLPDIGVAEGLLICSCGRWYPVTREIPEILPDQLRDEAQDLEAFEAVTAPAAAELVALLRRFRPGKGGGSPPDPGIGYKKSEIGIRSKVDEPLFFVPGQTSPFAPWAPHFTLYLIHLFGVSAPLLNLQAGEVVIDSGCGYAWTTEWLHRSGFDAIGVDICRTYLDVAQKRMGANRPHLIVADVENLPLAPSAAKAVFAYESFHHVPDRHRALRQFERALQDGGVVVLAEPGSAHEQAQIAIDAMAKYGILEKGMDFPDVAAYARGTSFHVEQLFLVQVGQADAGSVLNPSFLKSRSAVEGNLFRLVKSQERRPVQTGAVASTFFRRARARVVAAMAWAKRR